MRTDWYRTAKVRGGDGAPRLWGEGLLFAPELAPHVSHPLVPSDAREAVLRRALVRYLHGTAVLELGVVNEVAADIAAGRAPLAVSGEARRDAVTLYCDEGYHALQCEELLSQLGSDPDRRPAPAFLARLDAILEADADPRRTRFLFAVVTETAISRSLANLARNRRVDPGVRAFVAEHAADEARHYAYFARLFASYFAELDPLERRDVQERLPSLVLAFLRPDSAAAAADLVRCGLTRGEAEAVVGETHTDAWVRDVVIDGARPVLVCLERAGALAAAGARAAFDAAGWRS